MAERIQGAKFVLSLRACDHLFWVAATPERFLKDQDFYHMTAQPKKKLL